MKIIIASTIVPFIEGGGTLIVDWTAQKLQEAGHKVEVFKIPFSHQHLFVIPQMLSMRLFNLADSCDRLISIRTPSYLINHPNHVCWFIHHYRYAYELWNTKYQYGIPITPEGYKEKEAVINGDNLYLKKLKKLFTNSQEVSNRLKNFNKLKSEVLYPPLLNESMFKCDTYGDYIYYSSRIAENKRQLLAVQAMKYVKSKVKLVISGKPDSSYYIRLIRQCIEKEHLQDKITIIERWVTEKEKGDLFSQCLASIYIPYDEDSYGYPTLESFAGRKAVITCSDSGGTDEIILDKQNGYVIDSDPRKIACIMDDLFENKKKAKVLGENAYISLNKKNINWTYTVNKLTASY